MRTLLSGAPHQFCLEIGVTQLFNLFILTCAFLMPTHNEGTTASRLAFVSDKSFTKWEIESKASDETVKEPMLDDESVSNLNKMCAVSALKDGELGKTADGDESESIKEKRFKEAGRSSSFQKLNYIVDEKKTVWVCKEEKPKKGKLGKKILTCGPSHK